MPSIKDAKLQLALLTKQVTHDYVQVIIDDVADYCAKQGMDITQKSISNTLRWTQGKMSISADERVAKEHDIYTITDLDYKIQAHIEKIDLDKIGKSAMSWDKLKLR